MRTWRVLSAAEAAALDRDAQARGVPSRALMQRAGAAAATEIVRRFPHRVQDGVVVHTGAGNNGGDGWVVARALAAAGIRVSAREAMPAKTADAQAERDLARPMLTPASSGGERIIIDALLGTGARGAPHGAIAAAIEAIGQGRKTGATVIALDVPSGVDADTGAAEPAVRADVTLTFGTLKRGLLAARDHTGAIVVLDIGLGLGDDRAPALVHDAWVQSQVPSLGSGAHKGTRGRLAIVGGGGGMAGAVILAARAAMRSGIGLVRLLVPGAAVSVAQAAEPHALAQAWPEGAKEEETFNDTLSEWAGVVLVGPGMGHSRETAALARRVLERWRGPVIVDADGLNVFERDAESLGRLCAGRPALLTPHVAEAARLLGSSKEEITGDRYAAAARLARVTKAAVLMKGVPTIIAAPDESMRVSATGTPVLAAGGSGDILAGVAASLLASIADAATAGACAAWVHGRAGEIAARGRSVRGVPLTRVMECLEQAWTISPAPPGYPALLELPAVPEA